MPVPVFHPLQGLGQAVGRDGASWGFFAGTGGAAGGGGGTFSGSGLPSMRKLQFHRVKHLAFEQSPCNAFEGVAVSLQNVPRPCVTGVNNDADFYVNLDRGVFGNSRDVARFPGPRKSPLPSCRMSAVPANSFPTRTPFGARFQWRVRYRFPRQW